MVEEMVVKAVKRVADGTGEARRQRRAGQIPAVVYGNTEPQSIQLDAHDFELMLQRHGHNFVADLVVEDEKPLKVLLKDLQHHPISGNIIHADFVSISMTEALQVSLPVEFVGEPAGVAEGGTLEQLVSEVEISCLPADMVDRITVDVSGLGIGDHLTVGDLALPTGFTALTDSDVAVASVAAPRVLTDEEEAEDAAAEAEGEEEGEAPAAEAPEA
ncbi:MAG: 50S ribosomal protein L25 [Verrucomicrobia bacterium]|jgi:large subunit ribosomal protein L25|nr:50S ribosomal protein L25 [Verrucomicrobiota bacterium]